MGALGNFRMYILKKAPPPPIKTKKASHMENNVAKMSPRGEYAPHMMKNAPP